MQERDYYLAFSVFPGVGPKKFRDLLKIFGSAEVAWNAEDKDLENALGKTLSEKLIAYKKKFSIERYLDLLLESKVEFITSSEKDYPQKLSDLPDEPFVIYYKGDKKLLTPKVKKIGIVGTRKITSYGQEITESFTKDLVYAGMTTVSGLALGVDGLVHKTTFENSGKTIAVLGCGVDCCYPTTNQKIYDGILESGGLIISEYPLSENPSRGSFPARNRIIAALSDGLLVTEGAEDSGSLITANIALELGRKVFAIPGPVTSGLSRGPLKLIRKGAVLVTAADEILKEFQISNDKFSITNKKVIKGDTKEEQKIIDLLQNEPLHIDELVKKTGFDVTKVGSLLSMMEIKGVLLNNGNKYCLSIAS